MKKLEILYNYMILLENMLKAENNGRGTVEER